MTLYLLGNKKGAGIMSDFRYEGSIFDFTQEDIADWDPNNILEGHLPIVLPEEQIIQDFADGKIPMDTARETIEQIFADMYDIKLPKKRRH